MSFWLNKIFIWTQIILFIFIRTSQEVVPGMWTKKKIIYWFKKNSSTTCLFKQYRVAFLIFLNAVYFAILKIQLGFVFCFFSLVKWLSFPRNWPWLVCGEGSMWPWWPHSQKGHAWLRTVHSVNAWLQTGLFASRMYMSWSVRYINDLWWGLNERIIIMFLA